MLPAFTRLSGKSVSEGTLNRRALLAASTLSVLLTPRFGAAMATAASAGSEVPSNVQTIISNVLKVYTTKDGKEQGQIVKDNYRQDGHFIDPLMDVKGQEEIALAFYSLIKIFKQVDVTQKGAELLPAHTLPQDLQAGSFQQVAVRNQQVYHFARTGFMGRLLFPEIVDLDVTSTLTIDPQTGKIVRHEDVWNNKGFGLFSFMKRPNGALSGALFKTLGWKKDVGYTSDGSKGEL